MIFLNYSKLRVGKLHIAFSEQMKSICYFGWLIFDSFPLPNYFNAK